MRIRALVERGMTAWAEYFAAEVRREIPRLSVEALNGVSDGLCAFEAELEDLQAEIDLEQKRRRAGVQ